MDEQSPESNKLQWKWIAITFVMYLVFYLLPLAAVAYLTRGTESAVGNYFIGTWMFGGLIIVAAVAAYVSTGITIFEPAIASGTMIVLWVMMFSLFVPYARFDIMRDALHRNCFHPVTYWRVAGRTGAKNLETEMRNIPSSPTPGTPSNYAVTPNAGEFGERGKREKCSRIY